MEHQQNKFAILCYSVSVFIISIVFFSFLLAYFSAVKAQVKPFNFKGKYQHQHMWYDKKCCDNKDCAPVIKMVRHPNNTGWIVTTKQTTGFVSDEFIEKEAKPSKDGQWHACIIMGEFEEDKYVRCVYKPKES